MLLFAQTSPSRSCLCRAKNQLFSGELPQQVEVIDGHNLPKAVGQLSINPYVVLTLDGHPFARSSTSRGAAFPVWSSEVFMVKLPPPPVGEWHLTAQSYFRGYR